MKRNTITFCLILTAFAIGAGAMFGLVASRCVQPFDTFKAMQYVWESFALDSEKAQRGDSCCYPVRHYIDTQTKIIVETVYPATLDNRPLCAPIHDQGKGYDCAFYAFAAYITAMRWKRTGVLDRVEPDKIKTTLQSKLEHDHAGSKDAYNEIVPICHGCVANVIGNAIGISDNERIVFLNCKQHNAKDALKREIHKNGVALMRIHALSNWFELKQSGEYEIPAPTQDTKNVMEHYIVVCGWNADGFIIANTWGRDWGAKGFAILPFDQLNGIALYTMTIQEKTK